MKAVKVSTMQTFELANFYRDRNLGVLVTTNFALGNRLLQQIISKCLNGFKQLI
jgi:hypothetical protein